MQESTLVWVLSSVITVLIAVIGFAGKLIAQQVIKRLDSIIEELQELTKVTASQEEKIEVLKTNSVIYSQQIADHDKQLRDHAARLVKLEVTVENS